MNMDSRFEGKNQYLYEPVVPEMKSVGKVSLDWNLNDWRWDGDLFTAKQLTSVPTDCRNRQLFPVEPEIPTNIVDGPNNLTSGEGSRELEKRRRGVVVDEGLEMDDEIGSLHLNLGGQVYPIMEGDEKSGKKTKIMSVTTSMSRAVCQVEDCRTDLSNAKDYHRRHKVCDVHSKASKALVGNVMQRFCQQCSRFHVLQEFDEGKRSCRRRLAGHNKRRRKTHPDAAVVNGDSPNEERGSSYLLMSLLRLLSNMHSNGPDHTRNIDVLSRLIGNLASVAGTINGGNVAGMINGRNTASLLEVPQDLVKAGTSGAAQNVPNTNSNGPEPSRPFDSSIETRNGLIRQDPPESRSPCETVPTNQTAQKCIPSGCVGVGCSNSRLIPQSSNVLPSRGGLPPRPVAAETTAGRNRLTNIDLNNVYDDVQDSMENPGNSPHQPYHPSSVQCDSLKSSPPQTSRNSDSTSTQSPSSSSGEGQSRTDRIVFKLFGKDPNDFPVVLRSQILNWLSHSPTEIESYIRPGCIILTICLRLENSAWDELCYNLGSSLRKLLASSNDSLWSTGWIYTRVRHSVAILYNGQVVLDVPLHLGSPQNCQILCVKPLAVSASANVKFIVKGFNLFLSSARLLCALEGKYLLQDRCYDLIDGGDAAIGHHELQQLSFSCHIPNMTGRGFIEVEDNGLGSCSFPFIVAEEEICSEICTLETVIEAAETADDIQIKTKLMEEKTRAMYFVQEMGWLLHRIRVKFRLGPMAPVQDRFHFNRYTSLVGFSMDHDWCAVTKKLLDIIFEGEVDTGEHASVDLALLNMSLLHKAVKRNCRPMVELLLNFVPVKAADGGDSKEMQVNKATDRFLFRPDTVGPAGLTPLHVAASMNGYENVLDALTDDPGMVGLEAWKSAKDGTGLTPNDYASLRGHYSYIQLVQRKTSKNFQTQHVLDIPSTLVDANMKKQSDGPKSSKVSSFHTEKVATTSTPNHCGLCQQKLAYGGGRMRRALVYRPAMLSMVAIAAVCVCVALLFKSSPKVYYVFQPFSWESLEYGSI